jgi:hypothetical protein
MNTRFCLLAALAACSAFCADNALKAELKDPDLAAHWIYDDLAKATSEAQASGKPLLVELRCVPCPAGKKLDEQVSQTPDSTLEALEKEFVCVRVIKTLGLDLKKFQCDMDQSISFFFLNTDGTIYGRYGTRADGGAHSDDYISKASFEKSLSRALALHKGYPANKAGLEGKMAKHADYAVPEAIPGLADRAGVPVVRRNCIRCHIVRDNTLQAQWSEKKLTLNDLYGYPLPDAVGMTMNVDDGLTVKAIAPNSPAAKAGLAVGDELVSLGGQTVISQADIQWVLVNSPEVSSVPVSVRRAGQTVDATLALSGNWREKDFAWRSNFMFRRGFKLKPLTADEKKKANIPEDRMALSVVLLAGDPQKALAKSGLQRGDIVIGIDDKTHDMAEWQAIIQMRMNHGPNEPFKLTFMHGAEKKEALVTLW